MSELTIAEKILRAKADYDAVYEAGKNASGGGSNTRIKELLNGTITDVSDLQGLTAVRSGAYYSCNQLTNIEIPEGITYLGNNSFRSCRNLVGAVLPQSLNHIYGYSFYDCTSLEGIIIPDNVTQIDGYVFYGCSGLKSVTIGEGVTTFNKYIFYNCTALEEINFNAKNMSNCEASNYNYHYAGNNGNGITLKIGKNVQKIPNNCFRNSSATVAPNIIKIVFEDDSCCTSIGQYAFTYFNKVKHLEIPPSITSFDNYAFSYIGTSKEIHIKDLAKWCRISRGNSDGIPNRSGDTLYLNGELVSDLSELPESVTSIPNYCFRYFKNFANLVVPEHITSIGNYAFSDSSVLTSVEIGGNLTSIGSYAFANCSNCLIFDFSKCTAIPNLSGTTAFNGINANAQIKVPSALYSEWIAETNWANYANYIVGV